MEEKSKAHVFVLDKLRLVLTGVLLSALAYGASAFVGWLAGKFNLP